MAAKLTGRTQPRLWTPPLRPLNRRTSLGYEVAEFAEAIGWPLLPWQRYAAIHALELNRDGSLRFRVVLIIVGRQSGKSHLARIMLLYFMFIRRVDLALGAAQELSLAREHQRGCLSMINASPWLASELSEVRRAAGDEWIRVGGSRYRVTAANRSAGRGLSVDFMWMDEIRELLSMDAWAALAATTIARSDSLVLATTNAGDRRSVLLDQLRGAALSGVDPSICLLEWSAPEDADLWNREAWRYSIPALGYTVTEEKIATMIAATSIADARVEYLCQKVESLNQAVDPQAWAACEDPAGSLINVREQAAACVDVAPDGAHVTLAIAAQTPDGKVRVEIAGAWPSTEQARLELPALLQRIRPAAVAWFPSGPAAAIASVLRPPAGRENRPIERGRPAAPPTSSSTAPGQPAHARNSPTWSQPGGSSTPETTSSHSTSSRPRRSPAATRDGVSAAAAATTSSTSTRRTPGQARPPRRCRCPPGYAPGSASSTSPKTAPTRPA